MINGIVEQSLIKSQNISLVFYTNKSTLLIASDTDEITLNFSKIKNYEHAL